MFYLRDKTNAPINTSNDKRTAMYTFIDAATISIYALANIYKIETRMALEQPNPPLLRAPEKNITDNNIAISETGQYK
jgi:hypothetical protein